MSLSDDPLTELGLARRLVDQHGGDLRYAPEYGSWLAWDGRKWADDLTGEVQRRAKSVVDSLHEESMLAGGTRREDLAKAWLKFQSASKIRAMVELAETEPGIPVTVDQLDADPWALNVGNGIVDLRTGDLRPHDMAELMTKLIPTNYVPDAKAETWERFCSEVFDGDGSVTTFVQRFAGYSLTGDVREQMMIFAHGTGSNGKSTMLGQFRRLTGDYGVQLDPSVLAASATDQHPTGLTDLRGARFVATVETESNRRFAEALVKQLTGGDRIRARRMRRDYFEFEPTHHIWLAGNHLPAIRNTDLGIWRRIALVPFDVTFTGAQQDLKLAEKLAEEEEGILAWAIRGCIDWQREGLQLPERVKAATAEYRGSQDHIGRFITDTMVKDDSAYIAAKVLYDTYITWCNDQGEKPWTQTAVGKELTFRGFDSTQMGKNRHRTWLGIGLADERGEQV